MKNGEPKLSMNLGPVGEQTQIQTGQLPRGPPQTFRRVWVSAASLIFHGIYDTVHQFKAVYTKKGSLSCGLMTYQIIR